jgi:predicted RNase H-like HicB family nuclease
MKDYHINIFHSEEDGGYIADIPDLESCSAFGQTPAEALTEVETAKAAWLEAAQAEGKPVPEPRYRPAIYQTSS